ncbi:MAG TPA: hypothetical protein DCR94_00900 [Firmicutes bacterium]|nr:hypothetical protein [Bacillota bacterium]
MSTLELNHVYKVYPNGMKAVNDFSMKVKDKEFIVFVGPSGCGKSTTLRMIAGLEEITSGDIRIDGQIVNDVEPKERDIAMVFQNYALYPHMSVYDNIAFGLKLKHLPKEIIDKKVKEAAEILGLTDYLKRKPKAMSGGQRQRVALGRAIVREPKIFLLDEPLSNLDAKLRASMRSEISKLHNKLKTTFIYVTHDQVEAMTLGTRVVVMKDGFVQQIDTPRNLYRFPINKFVAGFIGTPQMNFFRGTLNREKDNVTIKLNVKGNSFIAPISLFRKVSPTYLDGNKEVVLGLRCEHISIDTNKYEWKTKAKVSHVEELGVETQIYADLNLDDETIIGNADTKIIIKAPTGTNYEAGTIIDVSLGLAHLKMFDAATEYSINPRLPLSMSTTCSIKKGKLSIYGSSISIPKALSYEDGDYVIEIPTSSIRKGGKITCNIVDKDILEDKIVYTLENNSNFLFLVGNVNETHEINDVIKIDVDLKTCTLKNDKNTYQALNLVNVLTASVIKNSLMVEHHDQKGKPFKRKEYYCTLKTSNHILQTNKDLGFNLLSLKEKKIFKDDIEIHFTPYDAFFTDKDDGIECEVKEILDFGDELFATCYVNGIKIFIKCDKNTKLGPNKFTINLENVAIYSIGKSLRLA